MKTKLKRLIASIIDFVIISYISAIPLKLLYKVNINIEIIITIIDVIILIYLYIKKDCLIGYESIGKKLMNLKIYSNENRVKNKKILSNRVKETLSTFPLYPLAILLEGKSAGDEKYNTEVK